MSAKADAAYRPRDTIFALATAPGRSAIAVVRLSGPAVLSALQALIGTCPPPRRAQLRLICEPDRRNPIDRGLVLWLPAPATATGEDMAEFHIHGGPTVIAALSAALTALPDLRLAEPGEFTRRAFLNGRLDLTEAEGIGDLIAAETAAQARQALHQMEGGLSEVYEAWRSRLLRIMAHIEAELDFPDEELTENILFNQRVEINNLISEVNRHLADNRRGERLRDGFRVALLGAPNAGKSSLLNALAKRDVALVSDEPGTTRDVLECHLDLAGYPVIVTDMAGFRETAGKVELMGIDRARKVARTADLRLILTECHKTPDPLIAELKQPGDIDIITKADLQTDSTTGIFAVSSVTGAGIDQLIDIIEKKVISVLSPGEYAPITRARHRLVLEECKALLNASLLRKHDEMDVIAEDLRLAGLVLGRLTGRVDIEDILDIVFSSFCIGK